MTEITPRDVLDFAKAAIATTGTDAPELDTAEYTEVQDMLRRIDDAPPSDAIDAARDVLLALSTSHEGELDRADMDLVVGDIDELDAAIEHGPPHAD